MESIMKHLGLQVLLIILVAVCCTNGQTDQASIPDSLAPPSIPPVTIPGSITGPDTSGVGRGIDISIEDTVVLYYWLPLSGYAEAESDLTFLSGASTVLTLPIQFDPDSRNHAQNIVNELGISLTVFMGDSILLKYLSPDILPLTVLLVPGEETRETGFGGPERLFVRMGIAY